MKIDSKIFKGIQYVEVNQLPSEQSNSILKTFEEDAFIKILKDGKILSGCIQYRDYEAWYHTVYRPGTQPFVEKASKVRQHIAPLVEEDTAVSLQHNE
ncbi:hypothetical protein [Parachryseolinea silvisoli]|jgi:hypothetical protein|uniref:hypothetical protein n=1 Tax=Parachryseolinea silvisoli TaxID=2873601 RepID=UPI002265ECEE|nr:hypothetical protein [Parachryseolinea silvisoli]MCD9016336.1 hypothetical protein [Parachryseolinea silvisoli]